MLNMEAGKTALDRQAINLSVHHMPAGAGDRIALMFVKMLRFFADSFFSKRYGHRAVVLETVAAVPGMVGGMLQHMRCLRRICDVRGWIRTLLDEAENERMHLMTFILIAQPNWLERMLILVEAAICSREIPRLRRMVESPRTPLSSVILTNAPNQALETGSTLALYVT